MAGVHKARTPPMPGFVIVNTYDDGDDEKLGARYNVKKKGKTRRDNENVTRNLHLVYFFLAAFSADFVTKKRANSTQGQKIGTVVLTFAGCFLSLVDGFDDPNGNSLSHVTDGETTKRRVLVVGLNTLVEESVSVAAK